MSEIHPLLRALPSSAKMPQGFGSKKYDLGGAFITQPWQHLRRQGGAGIRHLGEGGLASNCQSACLLAACLQRTNIRKKKQQQVPTPTVWSQEEHI